MRFLVGGYGGWRSFLLTFKETTDTRNERQASPRALKERFGVSRLQSPQSAIESTALDQLAVRPALDHLSMMKNQDHVRVRDRAQTMRHRNRRSAGDEYAQRGVNLRLNLAVDCARSLVQQQQWRV